MSSSRTAKIARSIALGAAVLSGALVALAWWETRDLPRTADLRGHLWDRFNPKGKPTWVPLWAISPKLQAAVITWEDPGFYFHHGLNYDEILRALVADLHAGAYRRGGSTITQQVAKNLFLSSEKSLRRKFREAVLARRLERALTKEEILQIYLNVADWGDGVTGAEAASRFYFAKSAEDLSWAEAAMLASIMPNPHHYNPIEFPEGVLRRRQAVLTKLLESGEMKPEEFRQAMGTPWRGHTLPAALISAQVRTEASKP